MLKDHKITAQQANEAKAAPLGLKIEPPANTEAPYFVEEVRRQLERDYGVDEVHGAGLRVYTTLDLDLQHTAEKAVLDETAAYERRHGWKGKLQNILAPSPDGAPEDADDDMETYTHPDWSQPFVDGAYFHALVTAVDAGKMTVKVGPQSARLTPGDWAWTQHTRATELAQVGDIVYVRVVSGAGTAAPHVVLEQDSGAQASMMAVDNSNGEVLAMVGGRDFALSQFNRATQSQRQVGSSFKPYDYTAAMEAGMKPTDIVLDEPTTFSTPGGPYTPHNYEPDYRGRMTLIDAFAESRNIPALRLADKVGIKKVIEVAHRFGITSNIPEFLPVAIGSADITLAEQVGAYSVFPNDGIRIAPHAIRRVEQADGQPLQQRTPEVREVISVEIAREMMVLLRAVVAHGTAAAASSLKHPFGGKTGTTNSYTDAWFIGFSPSITCGTWMGFDNRQSLGEKETGARAALPMWMDFMKVAIADKPDEEFSRENAPKRAIDVPMAPPSGEVVPKPVQPDDDSESMDDSESAAPPKPAVPQEPMALPPQVTPDDSAPAGSVPKPTAKPAPKGKPVPRGMFVPKPVPVKIQPTTIVPQ
jgi:penicillin-binding protein 1A